MTNTEMSPPYSHQHIFLGAAHDDNARRTLWVLMLTALMMFAEIAAGFFTGSMALLADGFHMATHAGVLAIAALAYRFAKRHAAHLGYSFGTGKVGDLAGFASALLLGVVAIGIALESLLRIISPSVVAFDQAIYVAGFGLLVNLVSAWMLSGSVPGHAHGHEQHAHEHAGVHHHGHDNNFRSAYVHILADAFISILAIVALLAGRYLGWTWLDPVMGLVGAAVIAKWAYALLKDTARVLLDATDAVMARDIRLKIAAFDGVQLTDLHVWKLGPQARAAIVSVIAPSRAMQRQLHDSLSTVGDLAHLTLAFHCSAEHDAESLPL